MNQILNNTTARPRSKKKLGILILIVIVFSIICLSTLFAAANINNEKIINNVSIANIDVSNMTGEEAKSLIEQKLQNALNANLTFTLDNQEYDISPDELGFTFSNMQSALDEAYSYGRDKNFFANNYTILFSNFNNKEIDLEYTIDDELYNEFINKVSAVNESLALDDTYEVSGDKIFITKGQDGMKIDSDGLKEYIFTAIQNDIEEVKIPIIEATCKKIDFNELYAEVHVAPQNASFTSGDKFEVIIDKTGIDFNIDEAKIAYNTANASDIITVDLEVVEPQIKVADLDKELFKDIIATYSTTYDTTEKNRVQNLNVASERCNSTIIYPGEEFSFHETIGTRTIANGYASAHSFAGGKVVNSVGGGICQISSTLYNIVLMADLEVTERKAHGMYVEYVEPSLDATIAEGAIDFKFINNRTYPIKIESEVKNGIVTMSLRGIREADEAIIEIESVVLETLNYSTIRENDSTMLSGTTKVVQDPVDGYVSEAYRIEKDANGNVISRTLISKDRYIPTNKIIKVGTKVVTPVVTEPEPEVEPDVQQPTVDQEPDRELPPGWDSPESPYGK